MLVSLAEMREYLLVFIDWSIAITAPLLYFLYFFLIFICFSWTYPSRLGIFDGALLLRGPATGPLVMVVFTGALGHMGV